MKFAAAASLLMAMGASAIPTAYDLHKRASSGSPTDTQILQYALTLENLENNFYMGALDMFSASDFESAGFPDWVRNRLEEVSTHESEHVALLSGALGADSVAPCNYSFPYTSPSSFLTLASLIENVGVSAYAGAAQYISDPTYLTIAAVILSTEARHQAWENSAALGLQPWSSAYDTALSLNMVYTIASAFITSCPSSNAALPVMAYPSLSVTSGDDTGMTAQFTFNDTHSNGVQYAVFYSGLGVEAVALDENDMATIPSSLQGIAYVLISSTDNTTAIGSDTIVAGPAILEFPFASSASNPAFTGA